VPFLILLFLAFVPEDSATPVGPPAPHLDRDAALDLRLGNTPAARALRDRWGMQSIRWDARDATPRAVMAAGVDLGRADEYAAALARLAGVDPADLVRLPDSGDQGRAGVHYQQTWRGAPVEGARLDLWARGGRIGLALSSLRRPHALPAPADGEVVLPLEGPDGRLRWALARRVEEGDEVAFYGRDGRELHRYTTRYPLEVALQERTVGDPRVLEPARGVWVTDGAVGEYTADDGSHSVRDPYDARLEGPWLTLWRDARIVEVLDIDDEILDGGRDISQATATSLHHFHVVRDWLTERRPDHPWLPENVPSSVDLSEGTCNAYYTNGAINFYREEQEVCNNFGEIADVVYHEYGHGVHHYVLEGGTFASDVSEGSADYISATVLNDPVLAPNARPDGSYIRELDTDRVYPDDAVGESHTDGLIWGSFLWNLREDWGAGGEDAEGVEAVDRLFLETLSYGPTLTDLYEAVLMADDDDGDLTGGTPHDCELTGLLDQHGLGPGPVGLVVLDHAPIEAAGSRDRDYPLTFELLNVTTACGDFDPDSAAVHYAIDPPADARLGEIDFEIAPVERDGETYTARIPRQLPGTRVAYYLSWADSARTQEVASHGGKTRDLFSFWVGDRRELWCQDFEEGWGEWSHAPGTPFADAGVEGGGDYSEWELGAPAGDAVYSPAAPWDGASALATNLAGNYGPNNRQYALSGPVTFEDVDPRLLLLSSRRWLTVEDGYYDAAQIQLWGLEQPLLLWGNYTSRSREVAQNHHLDEGWVLHDVDLRFLVDDSLDLPDVVAPGGEGDPDKAPPLSALQLAWTLSTDQGLEFGGWALDEVCAVTLDTDKTLRVDDLDASDDAEALTVTWTNPLVASLYATALVRRADRWPASYDDGVIVDLDLGAEPGAERSIVDEDAAPGETFYYALFVSEEVDSFLSDVVEGENADTGGIPLDSMDTEAPEDTDEPAAEPAEEPGEEDAGSAGPGAYRPEPGCSCAAGGGAGGLTWALLPGLLVAIRRRAGGGDSG
jgi:hypothetical protein